MAGFVHLHLHTEYSLLDGACRIDMLMDRLKEIGQNAVAITDHGVMYGAVDFYKAAKKAGIKPIIGCEVYVAARGMTDKSYEYDSSNAHLILLAKNDTGYQNLIYLVSQAYLQGFYFKPRIDHELLKGHTEGLIALSACLAGEIPQHILKDEYEEAKAQAVAYNELFGQGNFYLELQDHGMPEQKKVSVALKRISKETGIPLVATNDCHYLTKEWAKAQDILICIQTNKTVNESGRMKMPSEEFYVKSEEEMLALFSDVPEALENTVKIAEMCNVEFSFGKTLLPQFQMPEGQDSFDYLSKLCDEGIVKRYGTVTKEMTDRLNYELETIRSMGYVDYFLIVQDFTSYARKNNIPVGPGRGSAAGSIVSYSLGITDIDPLKYGLLFERFLNPERVTMPDIDIDFCYERRPEVIDYVIRKYGEDHVAQIITFGTLAARAVIRDVGRAMDVPYATVDRIAKFVPMELKMTIEKAVTVSPQLAEMIDSDGEVKKLMEVARMLEGMPRHSSTHAAGVVITPGPVWQYVPMQKNEDAVITQYPKDALEELGLLKMDFLGLRNLTVIRDAEKMIQRKKPDFRIDAVRDDEQGIYEMISEGQTDGVFQLESRGMKQVLMSLKPKSFEDIIAVIALFRPGPMESIPRYIANKNNPGKVTYMHPMLEDILKVTYGCIVYQEQVMQIVRKLAGYSYGRADLVRRAMAKKSVETMLKERDYFVHGITGEDGTVTVRGAVRNGVPEKVANEIFDEMTDFANYAFNKSHAAAYAVLAYRTAYLKYFYPLEYMAALLTSVLGNTAKVVEYISECQHIGIKVLNPHINESEAGFTVKDGSIRFGLVAIKGIGQAFINNMVAERESNGRFVSYVDFCRRMRGYDLNKSAVESLIKAGAMDGIGLNRRQLISVYEKVLLDISADKRKNIEGQLNLFSFGSDESETADDPDVPDLPEYSVKDRLAMEKEVTGMFISGHPMDEYTDIVKASGALSSVEIAGSDEDEPMTDGARVIMAGIITSVKQKTTKSGSSMAFVNVEDKFGAIEVIVFPKIFEKDRNIITVDTPVFVMGKVNLRDEERSKIVAEEIKLIRQEVSPETEKMKDGTEEVAKLSENIEKNALSANANAGIGLNIYLLSQKSYEFNKLMKLFAIFSGSTKVTFHFNDTRKCYILSGLQGVWIDERVLGEITEIAGKDNITFIK